SIGPFFFVYDFGELLEPNVIWNVTCNALPPIHTILIIVQFYHSSHINPPCFPPTAPISNVTINPETQKLVEGKDSLRLSCSSSGSPLSFLWMKDGSEITASDRVQITDGGRLLSIANVTRDDQGSYTCKVSNPVNSDTSDPANVTVSYGPEKVKLTPPAGTDHAVGSDITMVCSADSRPPAQFTWFLNGSQLRDIGSELKLVDVQENQSGSYSLLLNSGYIVLHCCDTDITSCDSFCLTVD
uniref:Ig-like domain-containing protein n=1 Tax=Salarias fasciatus TaxID=181472 RepID=A0A672J0Q7_SALFA